MPLHLLKLAVGIETVEHLNERQALRLRDARSADPKARLRILTRNLPRRADEVLAGGSLYWVVRGQICVRQTITGIESVTENESGRRCAIYLDSDLVRTASRRSRPFQGWRYFDDDLVPPDIAAGIDSEDEPPPEMAAELRELGLI